MAHHNLKISPEYYNPMASGNKTFELQEKLGNEEIIALRTLKKLCQLAGVEVKE